MGEGVGLPLIPLRKNFWSKKRLFQALLVPQGGDFSWNYLLKKGMPPITARVFFGKRFGAKGVKGGG